MDSQHQSMEYTIHLVQLLVITRGDKDHVARHQMRTSMTTEMVVLVVVEAIV